MIDFFVNFWKTTSLYFASQEPLTFLKYCIMYVIVIVLFYLAIKKDFEPLLLIPIAFGMLLANLPGANLYHPELFLVPDAEFDIIRVFKEGGLLDMLYLGVKLGVYPSLIFMGVGAMTDFSPLIANPKSILLGAAAQLGAFAAFLGAIAIGFTPEAASAIGIIGGADGPTAVLVANTLAPQLLGAIAIAAYSYMALIPIIQPPFMRMLTTKKERVIVMETLRPVSKVEKIAFPVVVTIIVSLLLPDATPLIGFLMHGNLFTACGVTDRLSKTAQNELINILTIFLGVSVGATANAENFLTFETISIVVLGLCAFIFATIGGDLFGKFMCWITKGKSNPLIGSAGVSAVPMAARVSQVVGQQENAANFQLMHAMRHKDAGDNGSAVAAGVFLSTFK